LNPSFLHPNSTTIDIIIITMRTSTLFIALTLVTAAPGFAAPIPYVRFFPAHAWS
jgi:hypothetical protein